MVTAKLPRDFKEFLKSFEDEGVQYLLIGGYVVGYYGYPRATADMDVWIAVNPVNASKCVRALQRFGMAVPELAPELFMEDDRIIRMGVPPLCIEIHTGASGVEFEQCFQRRRRVNLDGIEVSLMDLNDLKQNKRASGRHRDLDDLEHLP
jgi:hypothetical protein